ncbi:MAG TPA: hypothetical protein VHY22_12415 [Chthoniobacteraceae bacterium]|nr:hypothetical protein [Chthoniobacteraceae bacterium]
MNISASRQRNIQEGETAFIQQAVRASGLPEGSVELDWEPHAVKFNGAVELQAVLYDCRGLLGTPCWTVRRLASPEPAMPCTCGALVREGADGTYGSLRAGVAAALGELVRLRVFDSLPDLAEPILRDQPLTSPATGPADFLRT